jgi:polyketide synthase 12
MPNIAGIAIQLTAALEGPLLLYLSRPDTDEDEPAEIYALLADAWQTLVERLTR